MKDHSLAIFLTILFVLVFSTGCVRAFRPAPSPAVLIGAGDIGYCDGDGPKQTAALIEQYPEATVFSLGDNVYNEGTMAEFQNCFDPFWGRFKDRIHPVPGNHEYLTDNGQAYYEYFGAAAGEPGKGYYSYDLGAWHIVALNSICDQVDCTPDSPQAQWLRQDLQKSLEGGDRCTLLYWHVPHWSRDNRIDTSSPLTFWDIANDYKA